MAAKGRIPKLKKWDHVILSWEDAYIESGPLNSDIFTGAYHPCIRKSSGFWLGMSKDRKRVFITDTDDRGAHLDDGTDCENINAFPLYMVTDVRKSTAKTTGIARRRVR